MRKILILLLICSGLSAQNLQDWDVYTYMNDITDLAFFDSYVWIASGGGIYRFNPADSTHRKYTNLNGLASLKITALETNQDNYLLAGTSNGIIHMYDNTFDVWRANYDMQGEYIRDIHLHDDTLWVATDNGVGVYLVSNADLEFRDFYNNLPIIPNQGKVIRIFAGHVFYGTENGLIYATSDFIQENLKISQNWNVLTANDGLPSDIINDMTEFGSYLYVGTNAGVAVIENNLDLSPLSSWTSGTVKNISVKNDTLYFFRQYDYYRQSNGSWSFVESLENEISSVLVDNENTLWLGLKNGGMKRDNWNKPFLMKGPASNHVGIVIKDKNDNVWMTSGKFKLTFNEGFYKFDGEEWINYRFWGGSWIYKNSTDYVYEDDIGRIWIGSWGGGVALIDGNDISFYHVWPEEGQLVISRGTSEEIVDLPGMPEEKRNCLVGANVSGTDAYTVITAFAEDATKNIWLINYFAREPKYITVIKTAGNTQVPDCSEWVYFGDRLGLTPSDGEISSVEFDAYGRLWMGTFSRGILVLDYNGTIDNFSDDRLSRAQISTDNLFSNTILCIKEDKDQVIWIGTAGGLNSYQPDPGGFSSRFFKHVGEIGPVENKINHIFIDKYNNKWFSTDGGFSILMADKSPWDPEAWIHFTPENSGLPDKIVNSIYVDPKSGSAYIGTESGLAIFSGAFAEIRSELSMVTAGPNPFIVDGQRVFTIKNLVPNSTVKILTINGRLIRELNQDNGAVLGSRAQWDGRDANNRKVASGVYLFLVYNEEGLTRTGKISVVRP
jgi:ligand-binding sensor domain-containing protein